MSPCALREEAGARAIFCLLCAYFHPAASRRSARPSASRQVFSPSPAFQECLPQPPLPLFYMCA